MRHTILTARDEMAGLAKECAMIRPAFILPLCCNPFGGNSKSTTSDARIALTDNARLNQNSTVAEGGDLLQSSSQSKADNGAIAVSGNSQINTGVQLSGPISGTVTIGDGGAQAVALTNTFSDTIKSALASTASQTNTLANTLADSIKTGLDKVASLSESAQTGGVSAIQKTFLVVTIGSLMAVVLINRHKK